MVVRELKCGDEPQWDAFLHNSEYSTPQHLTAWKNVMEEVFHSQTYYLLAEEHGDITGVLPLIHIRSMLAGNYFTSVPGGICANDDEVAMALLARAVERMKAVNAKYLILRDERKKWDLPGLVTNEEHVTFQIKILPNLDKLKYIMERNTRQQINQASNDSMSALIGLENLNNYYPIYARAMRGIGTPTLGLNFFQSLAAHLPKRIDLISLYYRDKVVGGGYLAPFKQTIYCLWSGLLREYYDLHIAYLLNWESIKYAHQHGYQWIDMGRCRVNSGGYNFKKRFGGQVQQLFQQFYLNGINQTPSVGAEMEDDMKYRLFTNVWRRFPLPITEILGPKLRKQVPFG